jgi:hypothetical protein
MAKFDIDHVRLVLWMLKQICSLMLREIVGICHFAQNRQISGVMMRNRWINYDASIFEHMNVSFIAERSHKSA